STHFPYTTLCRSEAQRQLVGKLLLERREGGLHLDPEALHGGGHAPVFPQLHAAPVGGGGECPGLLPEGVGKGLAVHDGAAEAVGDPAVQGDPVGLGGGGLPGGGGGCAGGGGGESG